MENLQQRQLRAQAREQLSRAGYDPKRLALIHMAVSVAAALIIIAIDYYLNVQMQQTAGLSGMGTRSILSTIQLTLEYARSIAMPFWQMGFLFAALRLSRGQTARPDSLLEGFRRFGPVLRLRFMEGAVFLGAGLICMYAASFLFMLTPYSQPMVDLVVPMLDANSTIEQMEAAVAQLPVDQLMKLSMPFMIIFGLLFLILGLFLLYRFRMADFILLDDRSCGALRALLQSSRMTRRHRMALLKLDLGFWWFYLGWMVCVVIGSLDQILPVLGVSLPVSGRAAWIICYVLGLLAQLALFWQGHSYVQTTIACAYEQLRQQPEAPAPEKEQPKNLPWDEFKAE